MIRDLSVSPFTVCQFLSLCLWLVGFCFSVCDWLVFVCLCFGGFVSLFVIDRILFLFVIGWFCLSVIGQVFVSLFMICWFLSVILAEGGASGEGGEEGTQDEVCGAWSDGGTVRVPGTADLVGILMGYHGAGHLFRYLRHIYGDIRLLCAHQSGIA